MKNKIYCFGSRFLKEDETAFKIKEKLEEKMQGVEFKSCSTLWDIDWNRKPILLDQGNVNSTKVIEDFNQINVKNPLTSHDIDLAFFLKAISKNTNGIKLIVVPKKNPDDVVEEVIQILMDI